MGEFCRNEVGGSISGAKSGWISKVGEINRFHFAKKFNKFGSMQVQVDIGFEQLVSIVKKLPSRQWAKLKSEVERSGKDIPENRDLEAFLLQAPSFSQKQIDTLANTRKAINQWRKK